MVGGGLAGSRTVEELRAAGYTGQLTLVGAEPHLPYDRPPLSKAVLAGLTDDTTLPPSYDDLDVELLLSRRAVGLGEGVLETDRGRLDFDALVVATGAVPVRLPGGGGRTLRTVEDARALRAALRPGARVVVVGAGWIGAEVATAAARAGCRVTVVEAGRAPLGTALGEQVGAATAGWYDEAGVQLLLGTGVAAVEPDAVVLASGKSLPAHCVVIGIGVRPDVAWLGSAVRIERGVAVDEHLRSSLPKVYAVGDAAAWHSRRFGRRLSVEHWDNALHAPTAAAANVLGGGAVHDPVPYFWSEQFGRTVQYAGHSGGADTFLWRGDPGGAQWTACWLRNGVLEAVATVDRPRDLLQGRRAIAAEVPFDLERLADPAVPIRAAAR